MSGKFLDGTQIYILHNQTTYESVTQIVPAKFFTFASSSASSNQARGSFRSRPYLERKTRPLCGRVACSASKTLRQVLFSGISRSLPFFVLSDLMRFLDSDTWDHSRLNCSLFRMPVFSATSNSGMCLGNLLLTASRRRFSSSADGNRMRALFSARCSTILAGLLVTLPSTSAILNVFPNTFCGGVACVPPK